MIKAVFLDFDWTLYSHNEKKIPDSALKAIKEAQANGVKIFLSTGRDKMELEAFDHRGFKYDGYVLASGQLLLDKAQNIIEVNYIKEKEKLIKLFNENKVPLMLRGIDTFFINYLNETAEKVCTAINADIPKLKKYEGEDFLLAIAFIDTEEQRQEIIKNCDNLNVTWWTDKAADIISKDINKVMGIYKILEYYNINKEDILAIGDGQNDIEMMEECANSVAMGNSIQKIKDLADFVTSDIDEDGIYNAFKQYKII